MNIPERRAHLDHMLRQTRMHHVQSAAACISGLIAAGIVFIAAEIMRL